MDVLDACGQFLALQQRCKELFADLKELPNIGRNQWKGYFTRVFEAFTSLWKLQQTHRALLLEKCSLSRANVGDIASKIGQLYYHYYLRTCDTTHLKQSLAFYAIIKDRKYFDEIFADKRHFEKIIRYYARYAVVCVLLGDLDSVDNILSRVRELLAIHSSFEWSALPEELLEFTKAIKDICSTGPMVFPYADEKPAKKRGRQVPSSPTRACC